MPVEVSRLVGSYAASKSRVVSHRPSAAERLANPDTVLTRTVFASLPGKVRSYQAFLEQHTDRADGGRVSR